MRVTFDRIVTGGDFGGRDEPTIQSRGYWGPIEGTFSADGLSIDYDLASTGWLLWAPWAQGVELELNADYEVTELYRGAEAWYDFSAPGTDTLTVNPGPYEDLTISASITDVDVLSGDETLFSAYRTLQAEDLRSGEYRLTNRNVMLVVQVEVVEGE